jgi:hypothetical protein
VAAAVVDRAELAAGGLVVLEELAVGGVEGVGEDLGLGVLLRDGEVLEGRGEGEELAEAVPAEVVLLQELLDVLGAEPPAPVSKRPPPFISGTMESILALVPTSRIGKRSVR